MIPTKEQVAELRRLAEDGFTQALDPDSVLSLCNAADLLREVIAERDTLKAATDDWRHKPTYKGEPTGVPIIDRLHGIYTIPVNDGAGPLNGSMTFTQRYEVGRINHEAADLLREVVTVADAVYEVASYDADGSDAWGQVATRWLAIRGKVLGGEANAKQ